MLRPKIEQKNGDEIVTMSTTDVLLAGESLEDRTYRKVTLKIVPILVICYVAAYFDRVNISFAKLQMQSALGLSDTVYGLGAAIFFIGYFLFETPSNLILHRIGARRWITRIMISWGITSSAMMFVNGPVAFYVLRFLLGAFEAGFMPGVILYFTYWYPARRRARMVALFMTGIAIAGTIGGPLAGFVMTKFSGIGGLAGWQWLMLVEGLPTIVLGVIVYLMLVDRIEDGKWLTHEEKTLLRDNLAAEVTPQRAHDVKSAFKNPYTALLALIYFLVLNGQFGLSFWMPQLIKNSGVSEPLSIGMLSAVPYAVTGLLMVLIGRSSDRTGERRVHLALCIFAGTVGYCACAWFSHNTVIATAGLSLAAVGIISSYGIFWTMPPKFLSGSAAAAGIAIINSIGNLGGFVSPYAIGKLTDMTGSTDLGMYVIAAMTAVAAVLVLFTIPKHICNDRA
jgi:D-galactonate transporter